MVSPDKVKGHFPRKGERFIDGKWVKPKPEETAADRLDWLRKVAGWPAINRAVKE